MQVTATEAKNRFGSLCAQAKREPVFVEKSGQVDTVILSIEDYQALKEQHAKTSLAKRKQAFEAEYADWIAAQNALVEAHGIPGADLRPCGRYGCGVVGCLSQRTPAGFPRIINLCA